MKPRAISPSSYNLYDICPLAYYYQYDLGIESPPGKAAAVGTVFHGCYELASQHTKITGQIKPPIEFFDESLLQLSAQELAQIDLSAKQDVKNLLHSHIEYQDYLSKPILAIEKRYRLVFDNKLNRLDDCVVPQYYFNLPTEEVFAISGFIDLILEEDSDTLHIIDFKTGKTKSENMLRKDIQPQIYFLAASYLYPKYENVILTFDYIKNEPRIISFCRDDIPTILERVYNQHLKIINHEQIMRPSRELWKCKYCLTPDQSAYNTKCKELYEKHILKVVN